MKNENVWWIYRRKENVISFLWSKIRQDPLIQRKQNSFIGLLTEILKEKHRGTARVFRSDSPGEAYIKVNAECKRVIRDV
jgi:hypothetical protein